MANQYVQDEGDAYFGTPEDDEFPWVTGTYAAAAAGEYTFEWVFLKGDEEDGGYDGGHACLDEIQVVDAEMTTVTFTAGDHGKFTGKSASLTGGTFSADGRTYTISVPVGYKLQAADIPAVVPEQGYQMLSWFQGRERLGHRPRRKVCEGRGCLHREVRQIRQRHGLRHPGEPQRLPRRRGLPDAAGQHPSGGQAL